MINYRRGVLSVASLSVVAIIGVGGMWGARSAAETARVSAESIDRPTTTDPRHPVETYFVPPFLTSQADILDQLHLSIQREDHLRLLPGSELGIGGLLVVERALPVVVRDGGTETTYRTWTETVSDLLHEQAIELGDKDRVEPALNTPLNLGMTITITRVSVTELTKDESISFATKTQDDPDRPRGEKKVITPGQAGVRHLTYQVTRENGKEVSRKLLKTEVTKPPVDQVISVGTKVILLGEGKATWYKTPWGGLTAAHNSLPKGTLVDVVNLSNGKRVTVIINDRGIQSDAIIDLSVDAFRQIESLGTGMTQVRLEQASR